MSDGDAPPPRKNAPAEDAGEKRDRASILARRKFFIASALAGMTAASCHTKEPQVCLKVAQPEEDAAAVQPTSDTQANAQPDAGSAPEAGAPVATADPPPPPKPEPVPCLRVAAPPEPDKPPPQVCLRVPAPKGDPK